MPKDRAVPTGFAAGEKILALVATIYHLLDTYTAITSATIEVAIIMARKLNRSDHRVHSPAASSQQSGIRNQNGAMRFVA